MKAELEVDVTLRAMSPNTKYFLRSLSFCREKEKILARVIGIQKEDWRKPFFFRDN